MSKMAEIDLDRQQIEQVRGDTFVNDKVRHHLSFLAAGAEMASRHARALPVKPPFKTAAQDELEDAERALEDALQRVREAMEMYEAKPLENVS